MNDSRNKPNEAEDQIPRGLHGEVADGKPSVLHLSYEAEGKLYFFTQEVTNSIHADLVAAGWTPPDASLDGIHGIPWPRATASAPAPHMSGVDWHGLALDLESEAQRATSQTMQRAMEAAAHGLRLIGQHGAVPLHPVLLEAEAALEVAVARVEQAHPGATRTSEHLGLAAVRAALAGQPRPAGVQMASQRENSIYVAGPMTGHKDLNFPAFHAAAAALRAQGHHVENPAEINADPNAQWLDCMRMDIARLVTCDAIYLLPGWSKSRGAALEAVCAHTLGMHLRYAESAERVQLVDALHVIRALASGEEIAPKPQPTTMPGMTDSLREVLGMPVHQYIPIVRALQRLDPSIKSRFEDEQAALLHWALGFWFQHGDGWREAAGAALQRLVDEERAA